jgi:acetolactate synthase-1/3 small subunit
MKVNCSSKNKAKLEHILDKFVAKIIQCKNDIAIIEAVGEQAQIKQLLEALSGLGIKELVRSGRVAMAY